MTDNPFAPDYVEPVPHEEPREVPKAMPHTGHITIHNEFEQGSEQWLNARCGLITASEMKLLLTPTLRLADNDKTRSHLFELVAQRITRFVEPQYVSDDMLRGQMDEIKAREEYAKLCAPVETCGFITNNRWGFTLGYSPDGLVGADGLIESKSRRAKYQIQTLIENVPSETIPTDYVMQHQTGMLVSERSWVDFISYSGGLPMCVIRVHPDDVIRAAILEAAEAAESKMRKMIADFDAVIASNARLVATERTIEQEMFV